MNPNQSKSVFNFDLSRLTGIIQIHNICQWAMAVNLKRFFFSPDDPGGEQLKVEAGDESRFQVQGTRLLLTGPSLGKRSLVWALCASVAAENDKALVLAAKKRTENKGPPLFSPGSREKSDLWGRVQLKYVDTVDQASEVLLGLHLMTQLPRVIVLEHPLHWCGDLAGDTNQIRRLGVMLGALNNAADFIESKLGKSVIAIITAGPALPDVGQMLLHRWCAAHLEVSRLGAAVLLSLPAVESAPKIKYTVDQVSREFGFSSYA